MNLFYHSKKLAFGYGEQMNLNKLLSLIKLSIIVCVICLSILFLIISLFLPVFNTADGGIFDGLSVMIIGWMAIMFANLGLGAIGWGSLQNQFAPAYWQPEIFNKPDSRIPNHESRITVLPPILSVTQICASGRYGSFVNCRTKAAC